MSRFLFVVPPLTGHVTPLVAVAGRLEDLGHAVAWCGDAGLVRSLAGPDTVVHPCPGAPFTAPSSGAGLRGYAAVRYLWEDFLVPLADACTAPVAEAARRHRADVVVADMQALAGPLAAARLGLPWATTATTSAPLRESFTATPKVRTWLDGLLADLARRHGTGAARPLTPRELELSPDLVVAFTTKALVGGAGIPPQVRFVGPALGDRPGQQDWSGWDLLDGRPLVVTALGTVNAAVTGPFLTTCAEAFALLGGRVQAVVADPAGVLRGGDPPDVVTAPHLPMLPLLRRAAAVICHGGHNTVCESLAHGVPLVVAPIRDDQPVVAAQVTEAGAGVRVRFTRATPAIVRDAVAAVLDEPGYRASAEAVRASFDGAGAADAAAAHVLTLAGR